MLPLKTADEIYAELFERVQSGGLFADSKTFVDAVPRDEPGLVLQRFRELCDRPGFELRAFVAQNFRLPETPGEPPSTPMAGSVRERIEALWSVLTRADGGEEMHGSRIALPHPYVVPGGRFRELYYWDSYFTMLGLAESGELRMLENMVDNFAFLIDQFGFIPNGTRTYFATRSQPPFFVLMVELLAEFKGDDSVCGSYLPQLKREYAFWMSGADALDGGGSAARRVVVVDGSVLNRHWDDSNLPRQESHAEDVALAARADREPSELYREIRAACESGWDFSSRWFADGRSMQAIETSRILPIDLNALLQRLEEVLARTCVSAGEAEAAAFYRDRAEQRKALIRSLFFDERERCFVDLRLPDAQPTGRLSLATAYPLFLGIATDAQAARVAETLERDFLRPGGWVTTRATTGQQWDAPNGWAPLQWIVFSGLCKYGFRDLAHAGASRWIDSNLATYQASGRLLEKYNVEQPGVTASGGEYVVQDGFGWTNGVLLSLTNRTQTDSSRGSA